MPWSNGHLYFFWFETFVFHWHMIFLLNLWVSVDWPFVPNIVGLVWVLWFSRLARMLCRFQPILLCPFSNQLFQLHDVKSKQDTWRFLPTESRWFQWEGLFRFVLVNFYEAFFSKFMERNDLGLFDVWLDVRFSWLYDFIMPDGLSYFIPFIVYSHNFSWVFHIDVNSDQEICFEIGIDLEMGSWSFRFLGIVLNFEMDLGFSNLKIRSLPNRNLSHCHFDWYCC